MFIKHFLLKQKKIYLFSTMSQKKIKIKNLKISVESHEILKKYCNRKGIKIYKFVEQLIFDKCTEKKDIYGEN